MFYVHVVGHGRLVLLLEHMCYRDGSVITDLSAGTHALIHHFLIQNGQTPLMLASCKGHVECILVLLEHGALVNQQDNVGSNCPVIYTI